MANSKVFAILALLVVAIDGFVSSASPATPVVVTDVNDTAVAPAVGSAGAGDETIGTTDDGNITANAPGSAASEVVAGPLGNTSSSEGTTAELPKSGVSAIRLSTVVVGVASMAAYFF